MISIVPRYAGTIELYLGRRGQSASSAQPTRHTKGVASVSAGVGSAATATGGNTSRLLRFIYLGRGRRVNLVDQVRRQDPLEIHDLDPANARRNIVGDGVKRLAAFSSNTGEHLRPSLTHACELSPTRPEECQRP